MSDTIRIRLARHADVEDLAAIERESFSDPWPASAFVDVLAMPSSSTIVATDVNDVAVAYCMLLTAADQGEIANLAVATTSRRQGLAAALLKEAIMIAISRQVVSLFLEVRKSNTAARALYLAHGFAEIGLRRGYYQRPAEDALVLQWSATPASKTVTE
ncbi:MAG: ribosomal protein S18-alanine N-acetyltransferase [Gemmatimonadaceae bacterium]